MSVALELLEPLVPEELRGKLWLLPRLLGQQEVAMCHAYIRQRPSL